MSALKDGGSAYGAAGVDEDAARAGLRRLTERLRGTWPAPGEPYGVQLDMGIGGKYANVIDIGAGVGVALCTDGVGSKTLVARMMGKFDTIGIDCVAMNVNDIVCVGARPVSMVDYIAGQDLDAGFIEEVSKGLYEGARRANVSISGGEIAQLGDTFASQEDGHAFDLVGTAIGVVGLDRIMVGREVVDGDAVVGVVSSGIHSNGLTLARSSLFGAGLAVDATLPGLSRTLGEELLEPTHIYVREALEVLERIESTRALIHVTSDGFLNLTRIDAEVGFVLDSLPEVPPIFRLIAEHGSVAPKEMYSVYNMGVGFCFVCAHADAALAIEIAEAHDHSACLIGRVDASIPGRVAIAANDFTTHDLIGDAKSKKFRRA